jgi:hypothetical protein
MPFTLKAYRNYDWVPLPHETFADFRPARARAAALLRAGLAGAAMIAVCTVAEAGGKGRVVACLTGCASRGARDTEWPRVWEWSLSAAEVEAEAPLVVT